MEPLGQVNPRLEAFKSPIETPAPIARDTRFGLRQMPASDEKPSILSYANPGRGVNGEHLS